MKVFLDTNVVLDFLGERSLFFDSSEKIMSLGDLGKINIYVSALTFATCNYFLKKRFSTSIAIDKLNKFKILSNITTIDEVVIEKSLTSNFSDFEDAIQYFSATKHQCDFIITRNPKDFKFSKLLVLTPDEFLISFLKI